MVNNLLQMHLKLLQKEQFKNQEQEIETNDDACGMSSTNSQIK